MEIVQQYATSLPVLLLCAVLGLSRATYYRHQTSTEPKAAQDSSVMQELGSGAQEAPASLPLSDLSPLALPRAQEGTPALGRGEQVATAPPPHLESGPSASAAQIEVERVPPSERMELAEPSIIHPANAPAADSPSVLPGKAHRKSSPRAIPNDEQQRILAVLNEPRFCDQSPAEVYATLLDEGTYLCSLRTLYRILAAHAEVRERRNQLRHPSYAAPQLLATGPNQLWSWDITKLRGPVPHSCFHLYVILDVYSRFVVGWLVAEHESDALAHKLIQETYQRQGVQPGQLTLHADRGPSMRSKTVALLLSDLGVIKTHSRPYVSDDNPYSESQFKTFKYRPEFPDRFGALVDARSHCVDFFAWYNQEHHHSALGLFTPYDVHYHLADSKREQRARVLAAAYAAHPERFVHGIPKLKPLPRTVWINKPKEEQPTKEEA